MKLSSNNLYSSGIVRVFVNNTAKVPNMLTRDQKNTPSLGFYRRYPKGAQLTSIAFSEYGDDMLWYKIAEANNIDGPRLEKTMEVFIPKLK